MSESLSRTDKLRENVVGSPCMDLERLVLQFHEALFHYAFRMSGSAADAEDLTQQTFLIAQQKLHQVRESGKVRGWLFTVLRSCYLKSRRKRTPISLSDMDIAVGEISAASKENQFIESQALQFAMNSLPDNDKVVLMMFYFEELSYKEIASRLDVKIGTVMSRLARAKERLRQSLAASSDSSAAADSNQSGNRSDRPEPKQGPFSNFGKRPRKQIFF